MNFLLDNLLLVGLALVSGGLLLWPIVSSLVKRGEGSTTLTPLEATQLINHHNAVIVDLRAEKDFALGSLAGARNLPQATLAERANDLVRFKSRPLLLICDSGQQSTKAIATFKNLGFADVHALAGGIAAWKTASLPLVQASRNDARSTPKEAGRRGKSDHRGRQQKPRIAAPDTAVAAAPIIAAANEAPVVVVEPAPEDGRVKEVS